MAFERDHFVARRYRRRQSRVSQKRSESVRAAVGVGDLRVVERTVQDLTVVRRALYLVCWSGVRAGGG